MSLTTRPSETRYSLVGSRYQRPPSGRGFGSAARPLRMTMSPRDVRDEEADTVSPAKKPRPPLARAAPAAAPAAPVPLSLKKPRLDIRREVREPMMETSEGGGSASCASSFSPSPKRLRNPSLDSRWGSL